MEVAVVGGGITGLAAAWELARHGIAPHIVAPTLGGVVQTAHQDGFTLECGPNVLLGKPELLALLGQLGLDSEICPPRVPRYRQYVWHDGAPRCVPRAPHLLLTTPLIERAVKWRLPLRALRRGVLRPHADDESVATFFARLVGSRAIDTLLDPALKGIYGGAVSRLSARALFPQLWESAIRGESLFEYLRHKQPARAFVLRGGCAALVHSLEQALAPRLTHHRDRALQITPREGRVHLALTGGGAVTVDRVLLATGAHETAALLEPHAPQLGRHLRRVRHASLVVVHLAIPAAAQPLPDAFGVLFPSGVSPHLLGVMTNSELFPHVAPSGQHLLTVCLGGVETRDLCERADEELSELALQGVAQTLQVRDATVLRVSRWPEIIPQYEVGYHQLLSALADFERAHGSFRYIGLARGGVGVPDRVRAAVEGVRSLVATTK